MRTLELLRLLVRRHAGFVLACAALLGVFQVLLAAAISAANVGGAIQLLLQSMPPLVRAALENAFFGGLSTRGLLAFGWSHPISLAAGGAVAIGLGARAVAGEAESGALELLMAQPLRRGAYLATQSGFALVALALVAAAGGAGSALGQRLFGVAGAPAAAMLRLTAVYAALQAAWFAVALALSAGARDGGRVAALAFQLALASYIVEVIGRFWSVAAPAQRWSLYHWFAAQDILVAGAPVARPLLVLAAVTVAGLALAAWRFARRDLP